MRNYAVILFVVLVLIPTRAFGWTPFPAPDGRIAVAPDVAGDFTSARACLANFNSQVGASYYAVVVPISDREGRGVPALNDAVPYVDYVYSQWSGLQPETHVLIAMGLGNRAVAVHPGTDWVQLGFERSTITETIDSSPFKSFARSGDYPGAVCALARSIDAKLVQLKGKIQETTRRTKILVAELEQQLRQVPAMMARAAKTNPEMREETERRLARAASATTEARQLLESHPIQASSRAREASHALKAASWELDAFERFAARVPQWQQRLEKQRKAITIRPDAEARGPQFALERLADCQALVDQAKTHTSLPDVSRVELCFDGVEVELDSADRVYFVWTRVVPGIVAGLLLLCLIGALVFLSVRRRRVQRLVNAELDRWSSALGIASERLLDLETEFSMYFDSGRAPWRGSSAELDQKCADEVNRLFLMFAKAQDIHRVALAEAENAPLLRVTALERVLECLRTAEVVIEMGERETKRRIFLPLSREHRASAAQLLEDLAGSYERASTLLRTATSLMDQVDRLRTDVSHAADLADSGLAIRKKRGFSADHLDLENKKGHADWLAGRALALEDPVTASEYLTKASEHFAECAQIAQLGNDALAGAFEHLPARREELLGKVGTLRGAGYVVREPGFDPEAELERLARVAAAMVKQVGAHEDEAAYEVWTKIQADLSRLSDAIEATERARTGVPKRLDALELERKENESRVPDAEAILAELRAEHAAAAFNHESDNVEEIAHLRQLATQGFESARIAHAEQRYLAARSDTEALAALLDEQRERIDELGSILKRLEDAREATGRQIDAAADALAKIAGMRKGARGVNNELAAKIARLADDLAATRTLADAARPNWLDLGAASGELASHAASLRDTVERMISDHRGAVELYATLDSSADELLRRAQAETRDRPHVEALIRQAITELDAAGSLLENDKIGGTTAMQCVRQAENVLARARQAWESELAAFQAAEADLAAAQRSYSSLINYEFGYGIVAETSDGQSAIKQAQEAVAAKNWDDAVRYAALANSRLASARSRAEAAADAESEARAARARAAAAARRASYSSSSSSSSFSSSSSSSSSSFSSSSFSSSSSSGGSSYGSSSGGSSW